MTEQEWLNCKEPDAMLEHVRGWATDRQFRLFLCACIRRLLPALAKKKDAREICEKAIAAGEAYVEGRLSHADLVATFTVQDYLRSGTGPTYLATEAARRITYADGAQRKADAIWSKSHRA